MARDKRIKTTRRMQIHNTRREGILLESSSSSTADRMEIGRGTRTPAKDMDLEDTNVLVLLCGTVVSQRSEVRELSSSMFTVIDPAVRRTCNGRLCECEGWGCWCE